VITALEFGAVAREAKWSSRVTVLLLLETQVFEFGSWNSGWWNLRFNSAPVDVLFQVITTDPYGTTAIANTMASDFSRRDEIVNQRVADFEDQGYVLYGEHFHRRSGHACI
jgi:hypothetical protein